ncbi:hypothetical protein D0962_23070 [Leptolyngbyaceae cyanobacterium CCMR0082]|uniref:Uncharacterized protein n=1 Tax=Adonisia turfae CCMR0082 TaxID=2304604 RepID=A0A6M0SD53_9CYAN|nr:hypothetical protein [Adonisia turfae]NEZ65602.1 hypothetical protein [Adonisia turfae CCMR0082]
MITQDDQLQIKNNLRQRVTFHRVTGKLNRMVNFLVQSSGLFAVGAGVYVAPFFGPGALVCVIGGTAYLLSVSAQKKRLGYIKPVPGLHHSLSQVSHPILKILSGLLGNKNLAEPEDPPELTDFSYLPPRDKREILAINYLPEKLLGFIAAKAKDYEKQGLPFDMEDAGRVFDQTIDSLMQLPETYLHDLNQVHGSQVKESIELLLRQDQDTWNERINDASDRMLAEEQQKRQLPPADDNPDVLDAETSPVDEPDTDTTTVPQEQLEEPDVPDFDASDGISILFEDDHINPAFLLLPMKQRAELVMQLLAESGCDISKFINRPTFGAGGEQRSGKSTLLLLMATLEKALYGRKLFYITNDDDVYPIAFDGIVSGIPGKKSSFNTARAAQGYELFSDKINAASMGDLRGETWILDEFSKIAGSMDEGLKSSLWELVLTGLGKRGGRAKAVFHGRTSTTCGVPGGWKATFAAELALAWTDRLETDDPDCPYIPSGKYTIYRQSKAASKNTEMDATNEVITIPDWLLFDRNEYWGNAPCPIRSLLRFFPELDTRVSRFIPPNLLQESKEKASKGPTYVKPPTISLEPLAENRSDDYWDVPARPQDDPFAVEDYQATETIKTKKKVGLQDNIEGLNKTYEQAMGQISKWLRAAPGTQFTTSALVRKFANEERKAIRKVIRSIVRAMGKSPRTVYSVVEDPERGLLISYEDPEVEEDFVTIEF